MGLGGEQYGNRNVQSSQPQEAPELVIVGLTRTNAVLLKPVLYRPQLRDDNSTPAEQHWQHRLRGCREYLLKPGQRLWVDVEDDEATAYFYDDTWSLDAFDYVCLLPGEWTFN